MVNRAEFDTVFVVGAGFSHYADLPLQKEFTEALLDVRTDVQTRQESASKSLVNFLRKFISIVFDHKLRAKAKYWPELEDIFTCIDLSANTGHCLGSDYSPRCLRIVRRALIARIIRMLYQRYKVASGKKDEQWKMLDRFFNSVDLDNSAFISINWDTVIEQKVTKMIGPCTFDYRNDAIASRFPRRGGRIRTRQRLPKRSVTIVKMHGSVNWLYCDNCHQLFWFSPEETTKIADQLLSKKDWRLVDKEHKPLRSPSICNQCRGVSLSTRLATFSYRKALDFPMLQKSWFYAEKLLRNSKTWVFVGYSLPPADFEFKYLLKRVELGRKKRPRIVVITNGTASRENYQHFFGLGIRTHGKYFDQGLNDEVMTYLKTL